MGLTAQSCLIISLKFAGFDIAANTQIDPLGGSSYWGGRSLMSSIALLTLPYSDPVARTSSPTSSVVTFQCGSTTTLDPSSSLNNSCATTGTAARPTAAAAATVNRMTSSASSPLLHR